MHHGKNVTRCIETVENSLLFSFGTAAQMERAKQKMRETFHWVSYIFNTEYLNGKPFEEVLQDENYWSHVIERVLNLLRRCEITNFS